MSGKYSTRTGSIVGVMALVAILTVESAGRSAAESYCFRAGPDGSSMLRLDVGGNGSGTFALESWQGGGHSCSASGKAKAVKGGWVYREKMSGVPCEIILMRTTDGGIALADTEDRCRPALCGARAMISGLSFPPASRVDCAMMPAG